VLICKVFPPAPFFIPLFPLSCYLLPDHFNPGLSFFIGPFLVVPIVLAVRSTVIVLGRVTFVPSPFLLFVGPGVFPFFLDSRSAFYSSVPPSWS